MKISTRMRIFVSVKTPQVVTASMQTEKLNIFNDFKRRSRGNASPELFIFGSPMGFISRRKKRYAK